MIRPNGIRPEAPVLFGAAPPAALAAKAATATIAMVRHLAGHQIGGQFWESLDQVKFRCRGTSRDVRRFLAATAAILPE